MPSLQAIQKAISTLAKNPTAQRAAAGATAGGLVGKYVTPQAFGYSDNPAATNMSTLLDSMAGGLAAGLGKPGWKSVMAAGKKDPRVLFGLAAGIPAAELAPVGMDLLTKGRGAVTQSSQSMKELAQASKGIRPNPSISDQIAGVLTSSAGKGAGAGAGLAGLTAMGTGLLRGKSEDERRGGTSRAGMVGKDFLKYVIPAMIAGGVLGHTTDA